MSAPRRSLVVAAGTSRTRVRLRDAGRIVDERDACVGATHVALTGAARPNAEALRHDVPTVTDRPASFVPDVETVASETGLEAFLSMEAGEVA